MKRERILKIILILTAVVMLCVMPIKAFATIDDATSLDDFFNDNDWEDQEVEGNTVTPTPTPTSTPTPKPTTTVTTTPTPTATVTTNQYNTDIPKAGLAEDTMMVVAVLVLGATAIYAFKKLSDYNNI